MTLEIMTEQYLRKTMNLEETMGLKRHLGRVMMGEYPAAAERFPVPEYRDTAGALHRDAVLKIEGGTRVNPGDNPYVRWEVTDGVKIIGSNDYYSKLNDLRALLRGDRFDLHRGQDGGAARKDYSREAVVKRLADGQQKARAFKEVVRERRKDRYGRRSH